jgi:hypothetical protein
MLEDRKNIGRKKYENSRRNVIGIKNKKMLHICILNKEKKRYHLTSRLTATKRLQAHQLVVASLIMKELVMSAALDYSTLVKDVNDIGLLDGAETMGNGDSGTALGGSIKRGLDHLLRLRVKSGCGFVE